LREKHLNPYRHEKLFDQRGSLFEDRNSILNGKMGEMREAIRKDVVYLGKDHGMISKKQYKKLNKSWDKCHGSVPAKLNEDYTIKLPDPTPESYEVRLISLSDDKNINDLTHLLTEGTNMNGIQNIVDETEKPLEKEDLNNPIIFKQGDNYYMWGNSDPDNSDDFSLSQVNPVTIEQIGLKDEHFVLKEGDYDTANFSVRRRFRKHLDAHHREPSPVPRYIYIQGTDATSHGRTVGGKLPITYISIAGEMEIMRTPSLAPYNKNNPENLTKEESIRDIEKNKIPAIIDATQQRDPTFDPREDGQYIITFDYTSLHSFKGDRVHVLENGEEHKNNQDKMYRDDVIANHRSNKKYGRAVRLIYQLGVNALGKEGQADTELAKESRLLNVGSALLLLKTTFANSANDELRNYGKNYINDLWEEYHNDYKAFLNDPEFDDKGDAYFHKFLEKRYENLGQPVPNYRQKLQIALGNAPKPANEGDLTVDELTALSFGKAIKNNDDLSPSKAMIVQSLATRLGSSV
ncbi:MAG: hypothetical protein GY821_03235, partial [Gammaproteobacteria bacterium]|nr:hypothetical protein [Gammaproteobacteria bacterium]